MDGNAMPPANRFVRVQIPGDFLFQTVDLFLVHGAEERTLQGLAVLTMQLPIVIGNVEFKRLSKFPIQFGVIGGFEAEGKFIASQHPAKLNLGGLMNLVLQVVAHRLHKKQPVGEEPFFRDSAPDAIRPAFPQ